MNPEQRGFTLMELMVGMTIGMIATIVIIQVMSVFEAQRRTTTGSADAQTNGGIALYSIAREMQMAGFPMFPGVDTPLSCTTTTYGGTGIGSLTPAAITDGVAVASVSNASDSVTIRYGAPSVAGANPGSTAGVPSQITALVGSAATVGSNLGCNVGDVTVINTGPTCAVSTATAKSAVGAVPISITLADTTGAVSGAQLACVGAWNEITYSVNQATATLNRTAVVNGVSTTTPSVEGVVMLQAQYGISAAANSNRITQWVDASGGTWAAPTIANRNRIKAIRVAVVARNSTREASNVATACSSTTAAAPTGVCAWAGSAGSPAPTVDLGQADANWARYRYRVFETVIPLRNVIWSKDTL